MAEEPQELLAELSRLRERLQQSQQERGHCRELLRCLVGVECPWRPGLGLPPLQPCWGPSLPCAEALLCALPTQQEEKQELQDTAQELRSDKVGLSQRCCSSRQQLQGLQELLPQLEVSGAGDLCLPHGAGRPRAAGKAQGRRPAAGSSSAGP